MTVYKKQDCLVQGLWMIGVVIASLRWKLLEDVHIVDKTLNVLQVDGASRQDFFWKS